MLPDNCALVITSTVNVSAPNTVLADPEQRRVQYLDSIRFYIAETPFTKIIVCDNSGYAYPASLYQVAESCKKKLELL